MLIDSYLANQLKHAYHDQPTVIPDLDYLKWLAKAEQIIITDPSLLFSGPQVSQVFAVQDQTFAAKQEVLQVAGSLSIPVVEPFFQAIVRLAEESNLPLREIDTDRISFRGVTGKLDKTWYVLGDETSMRSQDVEVGIASQTLAAQLESQGKTVIFLAQKQPKRLLAIFACQNLILSEVQKDIQAIQEINISFTVLTDLKPAQAEALRIELGGVNVLAGLTEKNKEEYIGHQPKPIVVSHDLLLNPPLTVGYQNGTGDMRVGSLQELIVEIKRARIIIAKASKRFFWCTL